MNSDKIKPFDLWRMIFGDASPEYFIEVFFKGLSLYLFMLIIMRLLGKRMAGELTVTEMVLMVTLGASVAVAMQVPEGGVLLGFVILTCALLFERMVSILTQKNERFETLSQGGVDVLIKDGVLQLDKMEETRITRQQMFAVLRREKIYQLGKVERLYLEAGGGFSVYEVRGEALPGLPVFPPADKEIMNEQKKIGGIKACITCGLTTTKTYVATCHNCNSAEWTSAIL